MINNLKLTKQPPNKAHNQFWIQPLKLNNFKIQIISANLKLLNLISVTNNKTSCKKSLKLTVILRSQIRKNKHYLAKFYNKKSKAYY